jgi:predicted membrane-bound spermidine synthase
VTDDRSRRGSDRGLLLGAYLLTFLTGAAGLVYEITWQRYLHRLLGSDSLLSSGYFFCGRWSASARNLFRSYGRLELAIGLWALAFPFLFRLVEPWSATWHFESVGARAVHGSLMGLLLMGLPTLCMGATVPMLTRGLSVSLEAATGVQARVYGVNALGACLGAIAAGYLLIPRMGLLGTLHAAAALNVAAGLFFLVVGGRRPVLRPTEAEPSSRPAADRRRVAGISPLPSPWTLLLIALISGFYFLSLESAVIRITYLSVGASSRAFALVVAVFVLCIAIGSLWVARRSALTPGALFANQALICGSLMLLFLTLDKWPYWAHLLRIRLPSTTWGFVLHQAALFSALLLLLIVPVGCMGATLPLAFHALKRNLGGVGLQVGTLFGWNAIGNLLGGVVGGFLLYRLLGNGEIYLLALALSALTALLASLRLAPSRRVAAGLGGVAVLVFIWLLPAHDPLRYAAGTFRLREPLEFSGEGASTFYRRFYENREVLAYRDDPEGTFAVIENPLPAQALAERFPGLARSIYVNPIFELDPERRPRAIMVNGKADSNTYYDLETLVLLAHIPALLAPARERVLIVGLGTGVTAGEIALYRDVETIDVAEIAPAVIDFLPHFERANRRIHEEPRLRIRVGDAFQVLRHSHDKWDLIVSQPSNPWMLGVDQLYSRDYFRIVREHLAEDGLFTHWVQRYSTSEAIAAIAINTLRAEFPYIRVFRAGADDLLLASLSPVGDEALARAEALLRNEDPLRSSLAAIGVSDVTDLLARENPAALELAFRLSHLGLETLEHPRIHHLSGLAFFKGEALPVSNPKDRN